MFHAKSACAAKPKNDSDFYAACVSDEFERATSSLEAAYHLSNGLYSLQLHAVRSAPNLSIGSTNRLLHLCGRLPYAVAGLITDEARLGFAMEGVAGVDTLIRFWGEPLAVRQHWSQSRIYAAGLSVRWLRNECHNISLLRELAHRSAKRKCA
ncbi:hypothetical protein [Pacificitalea manganoxidans]|uniref:hypothetical protein n=1 Tax=Pacificitalea manganoxidans TaxID=1411902 RepID=UPI0012FDA6E6|nr:hypothetical protein [Pacificitalea manganoxidans]MDR6308225.1 hypothetical protein [Pacificitalea manganoxidans]